VRPFTCEALGIDDAQLVAGGGEVVGTCVSERQHLCPDQVAGSEAGRKYDL
jgi:hypothetical protein